MKRLNLWATSVKRYLVWHAAQCCEVLGMSVWFGDVDWYDGRRSLEFVVHNQICVLLSVCQLTACQPHNLRREKWGLSCYGLLLRRVEWRLKERERRWVLVGGKCGSVKRCFINSYQCQPIYLSLFLEEQSCVYHIRCVFASSASWMVLTCLPKTRGFPFFLPNVSNSHNIWNNYPFPLSDPAKHPFFINTQQNIHNFTP